MIFLASNMHDRARSYTAAFIKMKGNPTTLGRNQKLESFKNGKFIINSGDKWFYTLTHPCNGYSVHFVRHNVRQIMKSVFIDVTHTESRQVNNEPLLYLSNALFQ